MKTEPSDLDLFAQFQYGARDTALGLKEQDLALTQLMLMISMNYGYIKDETRINHGCVHIRVCDIRDYLSDLAAFAWMAVAAISAAVLRIPV